MTSLFFIAADANGADCYFCTPLHFTLTTVASKLQKALESGSPESGELFKEFRQIFEQVMLYIS